MHHVIAITLFRASYAIPYNTKLTITYNKQNVSMLGCKRIDYYVLYIYICNNCIDVFYTSDIVITFYGYHDMVFIYFKMNTLRVFKKDKNWK